MNKNRYDEETIDVIIGKNIKRLIKDRDETQKKLSDAIGITDSVLSQKMSGKNAKAHFTLKNIIDIANYLNVSIDELCSDPDVIAVRKVETVSDVLLFLFSFTLDETIEIRVEEEMHKSPNIKNEYPVTKAFIRFRDRAPFALDRALREWNKLEHALKDSGVEDGDRIITDWKKSVLSECENIRF